MNSGIHIIDCRGAIDIAYLLTWLDRYPCQVEIKGAAVPLKASHFILTSNLPPKDWYPDIDHQTQDALIRRLTKIELFDDPFVT